MARNQARPNKLIRAEDGTFGTMWGYNMDVQPIEFALQPEFWNSCRSNLLAGDHVRVTEMKTFDKSKRVTATCMLIVMSKDDQKVDMELYEGKKIYRYDVPNEVESDEAKISAEKDFGTEEKFIEGASNIEMPAGGGFEIRTDKGVVATAETMGDARAIQRGDKPINL